MDVDPVRQSLPERFDMDTVLALHPRPQGPPAWDPEEMLRRAAAVRTDPCIDLGHPLLDQAVRIGLAAIDLTFEGDHPKYGVGEYAKPEHDGFPPTIIAAVDALSAWARGERAAQLWRYWLATFVRADGSLDYYGPSVSEVGQLLHTAALLHERCGGEGWASEWPALARLAVYALALADAAGEGLVAGAPEADTRRDTGRYFHNNAWLARGLQRWADLCDRRGASAGPARVVAEALAERTLAAVRETWPADPADWWLSPQVEPVARPRSLTDGEKASYTNYRYWPELLSSGLLPDDMANRMVDARLAGGGQFCGMTRFRDWLDDWPLFEYLTALHRLGRRDDFLLSLYGHVAYHQAEGHLTAYEQVTLPPGERKADYCLPCQLVVVRAGRWVKG